MNTLDNIIVRQFEEVTPAEGDLIRVERGANSYKAEYSSFGAVLSATVTLTAEDLAVLDSVPFELVAAPGAGKMLIFIAYGMSTFGAAADTYPQGAVPYPKIGDDSTGLVDTSPIGWGPTNAVGFAPCYYGGVIDADPAEVVNKPIWFKDASPQDVPGAIATSSVADDAGTHYAVGNTFTVDGSLGTAATATVTEVANAFPIVAVNQGTKAFTVTGDASAFPADDQLDVFGSTGNDGVYTIVSAVFGAGETVIVVQEAIPSAVGDGSLGDSSVADVGAVVAFTMDTTPNGYLLNSSVPTTATSGVGSGLTVSIDTLDYSANPMTLTVKTLYSVMDV